MTGPSLATLGAFVLASTLNAQWTPGGLFSSTLHFQAAAFHTVDSGLFVYGANNPGPSPAGTEGGVILTDDGAASGGYYLWYEPSTNLEDIDVRITGGRPLYLAAGHENYGRSIVVRPYAFPAYPIAFDSVRTGDSRYYRAIRMRNDLVAFAAGGNSLGDGIIDMSVDTGATWTNVAVLPGQPVSRLHFVNDTLAFATTGGYRRLMSNGVFLPDSGAIFRSTNGGLNWSQVFSETAAGFSDVAFSTTLNGVATRNDGAILRTTDGGGTWSPAVVNLAVPVVMTSVTFRQDGIAFAAAYRTDGVSGYILISYDDGQTWYENFNTSGFNHSRRIYDLNFFDAAHGYACTQIRPLRTTGIVTDAVAHAPGTLLLFPNPAGDRIVLERSSADAAWVEVGDISGRIVTRRMISGLRPELDITGLAPGRYVLRLISAPPSFLTFVKE